MHVPSNPDRLQRTPRRKAFAAAVIALLASVAGVAHAVEFDEKLKAPMVKNGAELKYKLESYKNLMNRLNGKSAFEVVRDSSTLRERFDASWLIGRMVDSRAPLPELEALGFEAKGGGTYQIDVQKHPEWRPLDNQLTMLANLEALDGFAPDLIARGFRQEDIEAIRKYVNAHDLARTRSQRKLPIVLSASKVAKKYQNIKRPVGDEVMLSYFYQKGLENAAVEREWSQGLLDALEPQAQRILVSYLGEGSGSWSIAPTEVEPAIAYERNLLLRPDLEQLATAAMKEGSL